MVGSDKVKNMFKKRFPSLSSLGSDGNTSFLRAARAGHLDKVLEQLRNNVDINTSNANGLNALHLASKDGHVHVVTELLKRGANVDSATKKGNTALHIASLAGQEEVVRLLVEHGASVNVQSQNGFTPLYMAAQENHDNVVKYLLANGANQSLATEDGFTPLAVAMQQGHDKVVAVLLENDTRGKVRLPALHIAAKKDDCKAAALLLQNEHNPDVTSKSGFTPLHIASHYGNEGIANLLLNKGADVNYSAKHNITPLHVAAKWGKSNMVSLLLEKGANIESKTRDGLTPLHCAARSGHEQVVDMLLERGAPISSKTKNGLAPLHMSSQGDHVDAARILLYHRAPVDEVTVDYLTALHVAAHCGHARVAKLLLDRKADPNARALNGFTPLHIACKKNRIKVVELLLKHGASIEATTESGLTPLHVASFMGCMNIVIYLLQNEASPDVPTVRGETPLHLAARANQTDIIRILLRNGAQVDARAREQQTPLHIAARLGNVDIVMLLLQHGAQVDCTTKDLYSALHIAAKEGQDEVAAVLLENGASPTATTKKGFTPLHLAAKYGNMKVARLLLQRDAPVDAQGKNGVTPLHVASHYDHQNVALLLLDKGASPHATAKNGHTPLHIAAKKNQMDIATTLLEYGAKANSESKAGFTPLHLSAQEGHMDMSSLLIDHQADTNHKAKNGLTPLHLCAQEDRVNVASVLVKNGAEVDATTKAGYTPLHVACHFGQLNMVRFLLDEGSKVDTTTTVGYTPLHQAAQQGHCAIVNTLLERGAPPNATTNQGQTAMSIAQKLGYISVVETLKGVTEPTTITPSGTDEKYKVVSPETMQETFMSDSEDEGGEDTLLSEQPYRYLTVDEMKSLGDDSLPIDVRQDERMDSNRECMTVPPTAVDDTISPQHLKEAYSQFNTPDNIDISKHPLHVGFLVSFLVDARGGAMRGCRHSGVRVIVPPRRASMPMRVTCRYLKRDKLSHPPPLMEGEALASRILELGPVGAKFLGPVMIEVPHFGSLRGKEREIVILRSDNGETWREHTVDCSEEAVQDVLSHSFEKEDMAQLDDTARTTRILTTDFPHYFAVVTRVRQEVHAIGPEGGMVSSSVVPQVQAVFPQGALTKKIKVGLQAQPISAELAAKLLGNRVAVSPIVTVEPRRRKFHKPITLTIPKPQTANKGMINQYSGDAPTLRLLCSITGGTTRAQWEDVTGSTPFTFVNDCVSFTTTVSARFWLMDCRNVGDATKMATELYREAIHVPFMAKFVVFAKRVDPLEARLRIFCMTDDKEDKTLEHQEHFTEVAKSRDVEVLEGKTQYVEFAGNLVPVTKSGEQLQLGFRAFRENRLPFTVRVKDPHADCVGRTLFMREARLPKGEPPQQPICVLNIVLPEEIIPEAILPEHELHKYSFIQDSSGLESYQRVDLRLSDISNLLGSDWVRLADELGVAPSDINRLKTEHPQSVAQQGLAMLRLWLSQAGNKASASTLESALSQLGRDDIVQQCVFNVDQSGLQLLKDESRDASIRRSIPYSDKDIMKDSESVEDLSRTSLRKTGDIVEKDDKEERKYEAEEKEVEEVKKSVSERRKEIEKRLSLDKALDKKSETIIEKVTTLKGEELSEKEIAEEKRVSSPDEEPSEMSFQQKRLSFEQGKRVIEMKPDKTTMKEVKDRADERFLAEERKAAEVLQEKKSLVDETSIPFQEKKKSFEQGVEKSKEELTNEKTDEKRKEDLRRDSALFEGVSQGLVRLDAAFAAAPQVQDLLSPKVSKTPPPSPAEFKDITGTVAWTEEPAPALPPKPDQSQDWAEKGKPDSAIDLSNKGTSRIDMKEESQKDPDNIKSDISVTSKGPQKIIETIDIKTEDNKVNEIAEKDTKYQFTMSVPNKQVFTDTLTSITTFLEAEKNYNDQIQKAKRMSILADTEVLSSDDTEESQSRSESEPKSEKSFMGKMSKKLFGVFKKDEKERSEKKKGKKKKQKKGKGDKDEQTDDDTLETNISEKISIIAPATETFKEDADKTASATGKVTSKVGETAEKGKIKMVDFTKTAGDKGKGIKDKTISETENLLHKFEDNIDGVKSNVVDITNSAGDSTKAVAIKTVTIIDGIKEKSNLTVTKEKDNAVETTKAAIIKIDEIKGKGVLEADHVGDDNVGITEQFESNVSDSKNFDIESGKVLTDKTTSLNADIADKIQNITKESKDKSINAAKHVGEVVQESTGKSVSIVGSLTDKGKSTTLTASKVVGETVKEAKDKSVTVAETVSDKTSEIMGDVKNLLVSTTNVVGDTSKEAKYKTISFTKDVAGTVGDTLSQGKTKTAHITTSAVESAKYSAVSTTEDVINKGGKIAREGKMKATETVKETGETIKGTKEKTKSFFGGIFSKAGEAADEGKSKISETKIEAVNETQDNTVLLIDDGTDISSTLTQLSQPEDGKSQPSKTTKVISEAINKAKDTTISVIESSVDKAENSIIEEKRSVNDTTKHVGEKIKGTKEKGKSFFGGFFGKTEETIEDKKNKAFTTPSGPETAIEEKDKAVSGDMFVETSVEAQQTKSKIVDDNDSESIAVENLRDITASITGEVLKETKTEVKDDQIQITDSAQLDIDKSKEKTVLLAGNIADTTSKEMFDPNNTKVIEHSKVPKEKGKSFFGGLFSKAEDILDDSKTHISDTNTRISETAKGIKDRSVSVKGDVIDKTGKVIDNGNIVLADKMKAAGGFVNDTKDKAKFGAISLSDKTEETLASGKLKIAETAKTETEKAKEKTISISEKVYDKTVDVTKDSVAKVDDTFKAVTESAKNTKEKSKSFLGAIFSKSEAESSKIKTPEIDTPLLKTTKEPVLKKGDEIGSTKTFDATISGSEAANGLKKEITEISSFSVDDSKINVIESAKPASENVVKAELTVTSVTNTGGQIFDPNKDKVVEITLPVSESANTAKEKTKSFLGGIFSKAEDVVSEIKSKGEDTRLSFSKDLSATKDKMTLIAEGAIDTSGEVMGEEKNKAVETKKYVKEITKNATDNTTSVATTIVQKSEKILDDGKTMISETSTTVIEKTIPLTEDIVSKASNVMDQGKTKVLQTTKSVSKSTTEAKGHAKSLFGTVFGKGDELKDSNEITVTNAPASVPEIASGGTQKPYIDRDVSDELIKDTEESQPKVYNEDNIFASSKDSKGILDQTSTVFRSVFENTEKSIKDSKRKIIDQATAISTKLTENTEKTEESKKDDEHIVIDSTTAIANKLTVDNDDTVCKAAKEFKDKTASVAGEIVGKIKDEEDNQKVAITDTMGTFIEHTKEKTSSIAKDASSKIVDITNEGKNAQKPITETVKGANEKSKSCIAGIFKKSDKSVDGGTEPLAGSVESVKESTIDVTNKAISLAGDTIEGTQKLFSPVKRKLVETVDVKIDSKEKPKQVSDSVLEQKKQILDDGKLPVIENLPTLSEETQFAPERYVHQTGKPVNDVKLEQKYEDLEEIKDSERYNKTSLVGKDVSKVVQDERIIVPDGEKLISESSEGIKKKTLSYAGDVLERVEDFTQNTKQEAINTSKAMGKTAKDFSNMAATNFGEVIDNIGDTVSKGESSTSESLINQALEKGNKESINVIKSCLPAESSLKSTDIESGKIDNLIDDTVKQTTEIYSTIEENLNKKSTQLLGDLKNNVGKFKENGSAETIKERITKIEKVPVESIEISISDAKVQSSLKIKELDEKKIKDLHESIVVIDDGGNIGSTTISIPSFESIGDEIDEVAADETLDSTRFVEGLANTGKVTETIPQKPENFQKSESKLIKITSDNISEVIDETSIKASTAVIGTGKNVISAVKSTEFDPSSGVTKIFEEIMFEIPQEKSKQTFGTEKTTQETPKSSNDDIMNNILIDMLIEQECMKYPLHDISPPKAQEKNQSFLPDSSNLPEKHDTEILEKASKNERSSGFKTIASFGQIESLISEGDFIKSSEKDISGPSSYVTTPSMQRRKIGGSQRLSREERPALRDVSHIIDYSSSEEDEPNNYIVTEPFERSTQRTVTFHVESEDESSLKVSDASSDPEVEVTEMTPSPIPTSKKQGKFPVEEGAKFFEDQSKKKSDKKVERRFERMASETLEADPEAKFTADREFQRMVSQLSNEEVDACLSQWEDGGLTPSEELDSTKDTVEGDLDPDVEALPEASTNPFYTSSSQWQDFEHDFSNAPPSVFWAFDTTPTSVIIQPNELDIPVKTFPVKGESASEEAKKSPAPTTTREGEEALLDLAAGLQDSKGGAGSGPSSAK